MLQQEDMEKIERYVNGLADEKEKAFVEFLFVGGENNTELKQALEKDWEMILGSSEKLNVNISYILDRIHHTIHLKEQVKKPTPIKRFINIYAKVAAILLIPLIIAWGYIFNQGIKQNNIIADQPVKSEIFAPLGSRVSFNLPDGTTGMLNSGSHLSYTLPFSNNRMIDLQGEAWFEVHHDAKHPFKISTGNSTVKVLGTSFNVSAYPTENYVEVVLLEGKVEFLDNEKRRKVDMQPSDRLVFEGGKISKSVVDPEKYSAWTEGKLVFRGDPMLEVARRIERWYNVKVELADKKLEYYSFRATFQDDKVEDVFRFLSMTTPIRYKIIPRQLLPDSTYSKEVVTIYMNN